MIIATRTGDREMRTANLAGFGIGRFGSGNSSGVSVTPSTVSGIPAFNRAVRIASEAVASLRMRVWRGEGVNARQVDSVWQSRLFKDALNECQSRFVFWETVEESLSKRGNAFIWKVVDPATNRAVELYALHPDQVNAVLMPEGVRYVVMVSPGFVDPVGKGFGLYTVGEDTILHIRGSGSGGGIMAPSPIDVFRESLGVGVAKLQHEGNLYARGGPRLLITTPAEKSPEQLGAFRDLWRATYEGPQGQGTAVLGGGATVTPITMTQSDSQFIESQNFGVAECARIVGVPASLLDEGGSRSTSTPLTPEHEQARWLRYGLNGRLERIESALYHDPNLFADGSSTYPAFDTERFIRGDLATEDAIAHQRVQDGRLLVDEWRAEQGLPDLPNGAGKVPQITPVGGGANPSDPGLKGKDVPSTELPAA